MKFKKIIAVALAATMVIGSTVTAFAADVATSGGATGEGTPEGHVDTHVVKVTLPTDSNTTTFAYKMDAERLIQDTAGGRYEDAVFPADKDTDTGVYFLTGTNDDSKNVYANTSAELTVTSESSADVKLTVSVEVESAATDITLVDAAPGADVTEPQLYLGLKVDDGTSPVTKAVKKGEKVSTEVTIDGIETNFKKTVKADKSGYEYSPLVEGDTGYTDWNTATISMTGAVSKASAKNLTAPKLKITWSWTDPEAGLTLSNATANTADTGVDFDATFTKGTAATYTFSGLGAGVTVSSVTQGASASTATGATALITASGTSFTIAGGMWASAQSGDVKYVKLTISNGTTIIVKVTIA